MSREDGKGMARATGAWGGGLTDTYLNLGWFSHEYSLEDFGQVPQVKGIVGLGWCGQQLGGDDTVDTDGGVHEGLRHMDDIGGPSCGAGEWAGSHRQLLALLL